MLVAESNTFGARLTELREKAKITRYRLAQISGVSLQTISQLEKGNYDPSWETVKRLARALEVPINEFDTGDDPRKEEQTDVKEQGPAKKKPKK